MCGRWVGCALIGITIGAYAGPNAWTSLPGPTADGSALINVLVASPANPALRFAATQGGMYVSRNGGLGWQASNGGIVRTPAGYASVNDMVVTADTVYITPHFLQKSTDAGGSWLRTGWVSENPQALVLAVDPASPSVVYAGSNQGLYKSSDAGATWKYLAGSLPVAALAVDPGNPAVLFRAVASGIYRSTDAGLTWSQVSTQLTSVRTIVVDPRDSSRVFAGTNGAGVHRSTDGGTTWSAVNRCLPADTCAPTNLDRTWVKSIVFDRSAPSTIYLGASEGLFRSVDGGASWTQARNTGAVGVAAMMLDPLERDTVIVAWGGRLYAYTFVAGSDWDRIFDWAEATYPQYFAPRASTQQVSGYQARWYAATQAWLGATEGRVYVHGSLFGGLQFVGTTAQLLPLAAAAGY